MPINNVTLGQDVQIRQPDLVNLYGCTIGDGTRIGAFVEVQKNAAIGARCKISSHTFVCEGVNIEDEVFVGHGVMFINDRYPRATAEGGGLQTEADWAVVSTRIKQGAVLRQRECNTLRSDRRQKRPGGSGSGSHAQMFPITPWCADVPARLSGDVRKLKQPKL